MTTHTAHTAPFSSTLPGRYYYDPALYEQEQQRIFSQLWFRAGHTYDPYILTYAD